MATAPFAFAGLWERWNSGGEAICTFTILTTTPNEVLQPIHERMPVILRRDDYGLWLNPAMNKIDCLAPLLAPYAASEMTAFPVSTRVNSPPRDDAACREPLDKLGTDSKHP